MNSHGLTRENLVATLPIALQKDLSAVALAEAMAELLAQRPAEIERLRIYPVIDRLDEQLLDILAYDFKVDWWDADYSLDEKRRTLKDSWRVHKQLGTRAAVETAVSAIYSNSKVREWWEYGGKPYHFQLLIDAADKDISPEKLNRVITRVEFYKNLRSFMDGIFVKLSGAAFSNISGNLLLRRFTISIFFSHLQDMVFYFNSDTKKRIYFDGEILFNQLSVGICLTGFEVRTRFIELCRRAVRFDGEAGFDGTIQFDQTISSTGISTFGILARLSHKTGLSGPNVRLSALRIPEKPGRAGIPRMTVTAALPRHKVQTGGTVTMDNWRGMAGDIAFDGNYKFDAYLVKEEL